MFYRVVSKKVPVRAEVSCMSYQQAYLSKGERVICLTSATEPGWGSQVRACSPLLLPSAALALRCSLSLSLSSSQSATLSLVKKTKKKCLHVTLFRRAVLASPPGRPQPRWHRDPHTAGLGLTGWAGRAAAARARRPPRRKRQQQQQQPVRAHHLLPPPAAHPPLRLPKAVRSRPQSRRQIPPQARTGRQGERLAGGGASNPAGAPGTAKGAG